MYVLNAPVCFFWNNTIFECEIKIFKGLLNRFSIHGPSLGFLGPHTPKYCLILLKF